MSILYNFEVLDFCFLLLKLSREFLPLWILAFRESDQKVTL